MVIRFSYVLWLRCGVADLNGRKGLSSTLLGLSCLLLSSCSLNEAEFQNNLPSPSSYGVVEDKNTSLAVYGKDKALAVNFYQSFNDDKLNGLIERALKNNYDMNSAYLNLKQAQLDFGLARTSLHPTASASMSSSARKDLSQSSDTNKSSSMSFGLSYEADLFGRLDAMSRASWESYKASAYDYKAMRLTLIKRTSEYYWNYAYSKEALDLAEKQLEASFKRLDLIKEKQLQGAADGLEYDLALVNHKNVEQAVYQRSFELTSAQNALTTLLGAFTEDSIDQLVTDRALQTTKSPIVPVEMPASLLKNRPDLMAYESRVKAAYANVDEANASFYPSFNLNAAIGTGSASSLARFLTDPIGSLGAAITFPFFNYNELSLQKESTLVAKDKAKLDFANGFIVAVQEVSDNLNNLQYQEQLIKSTKTEYDLTVKNYERYAERYRYGSASLSDVLDAADNLRSAQNKLLQAKLNLLTASMNLMVSLGGDTLSEQNQTLANNSGDDFEFNPDLVLEQAANTNLIAF